MQILDAGATRRKKEGFHLGRTAGAERDFARTKRLVSIPGDQQHLAASIASLMKGHRGRDARISQSPRGDLYVAQLQIVRQLLFPEADGVYRYAPIAQGVQRLQAQVA